MRQRSVAGNQEQAVARGGQVAPVQSLTSQLLRAVRSSCGARFQRAFWVVGTLKTCPTLGKGYEKGTFYFFKKWNLLSAHLDLIFSEFPNLVGLKVPAAVPASGAGGSG
jgi:hypothetical protein